MQRQEYLYDIETNCLAAQCFIYLKELVICINYLKKVNGLLLLSVKHIIFKSSDLYDIKKN